MFGNCFLQRHENKWMCIDAFIFNDSRDKYGTKHLTMIVLLPGNIWQYNESKLKNINNITIWETTQNDYNFPRLINKVYVQILQSQFF